MYPSVASRKALAEKVDVLLIVFGWSARWDMNSAAEELEVRSAGSGPIFRRFHQAEYGVAGDHFAITIKINIQTIYLVNYQANQYQPNSNKGTFFELNCQSSDLRLSRASADGVDSNHINSDIHLKIYGGNLRDFGGGEIARLWRNRKVRGGIKKSLKRHSLN